MAKHVFFIVGGPGSGKDLIIKEVFSDLDFVEYNIDQIKSKKFYRENMVVVANAYNFDKIRYVNEILESKYYKTNIVFVDVADDISKERLNERNIEESIIETKLNTSRENLDKFIEMFDMVYYFDNSYHRYSNEIEEQLEYLGKEIGELLESPLNRFKKKINKKGENSYDPMPATKDGINPTYDTRAAGNGDLIKNYQYEAMDPNPLDSGIGFGSNMGNYSKQEPMFTLRDTAYDKTEKPVFKRLKKIIFKKKDV